MTHVWDLLPHQDDLVYSKASKCAMICGRGAGKSYALSYLSLRDFVQGKNVLVGAQSVDTLHDSLWTEIKERAKEAGIHDFIDWHERPMRAYFNGATVSKHEKGGLVNTVDKVSVEVVEAGGKWTLDTNVYDLLGDFRDAILTTEDLGRAFQPEQRFENPDGTPIAFDRDFLGNHRGVDALPGPFASAEAAKAVLG